MALVQCHFDYSCSFIKNCVYVIKSKLLDSVFNIKDSNIWKYRIINSSSESQLFNKSDGFIFHHLEWLVQLFIFLRTGTPRLPIPLKSTKNCQSFKSGVNEFICPYHIHLICIFILFYFFGIWEKNLYKCCVTCFLIPM
jgi:hypothetical protein